MTEPSASTALTMATTVQPLLPGDVFIKVLVTAAVSLVAGILGKILWDFIKGGRVEKAPVYMTIASCQETRNNCSVSTLSDKVTKTREELEAFKAETSTNLKAMDKRIDVSSRDIRAMRRDISEIKQVSAASNAILETIQKGIEKKII